MIEQQSIPVFVPPLITMLFKHEKQKGTPLTEQEVLDITDNSICIMMQIDRARQMAKSRGYDDIDPSNVWQEWQIIRLQSHEK
jgi:hypothetical protein